MKSENKRALISYIAAAALAALGYFGVPAAYMYGVSAGMGNSLLAYYLVNAVQQLFLFIAPAILILRARENRWQRFLSQWKRLSVDTTGYCMLLSVACTVVVSLAVALWLPLVEGTLGYVPEDTPLPEPENAAQWAMALLCVAVVPAIAEELFFRGFLQTAVSKFFPRGAVWGVALAFAALHLDIAALPGLFLMGCLLGKIMIKRGIGASMLFHGLYNAAVLLLNMRDVQIGTLSIFLCLFAFFFCVRRLMREEETHAADGSRL